MAEYPLLVFPTERVVAEKKDAGKKIRPVHTVYPSRARQGERIGPKFQALEEALDAGRIRMGENADAVDPEEILVLETAVNIEDFVKTVRRVPGLEWLGEEIREDMESTDDFYILKDDGNRDDHAKFKDGRVYLMSTNHQALQQLKSYWEIFKSGTNDYEYGFKRFDKVFECLTDLRSWGVKDRIPEAAKQRLAQIIDLNPGQNVKMEIELWHRSNPNTRAAKISECAKCIRECGGEIIDQCDILEIEYTAFLVSLPCNVVEDVISYTNCRFFTFDGIKYAGPQSLDILPCEHIDPANLTTATINDTDVPEGNPVAGVLDGFPLQNHSILRNRLVIDDPDNIEDRYLAENRHHCTNMCSCILKGDLNDNGRFIANPLYVRPIMELQRDFHGRIVECLPDKLLADLIHRAVKRMFDGEGEIPPTAPSVRVINFSIGDSNCIYTGIMSPFARMLDYLSEKYRVLFIVSAGNSSAEIPTDLNGQQLKAMSQADREKEFFNTLKGELKNKRLISPSESINNITVGALHEDSSGANQVMYSIEPFSNSVPCFFSSFGSGYNRSIKPDLVEKGGRMIYSDIPTNGVLAQLRNIFQVPGIAVAYPDNTLCNVARLHGTSEAAALTTRNAYFCYKTIESMSVEHPEMLDYCPELIKAMLVHGCNWDFISDHIDNLLPPATSLRDRKEIKRLMLGYGRPDIEMSTGCNANYATVISYGVIEEDEGLEYQIPLPMSLSAQPCKRRLTITLAWLSGINSKSKKYRGRKLFISDPKNKIADNRINNGDYDTKRGTIQHDVFEGKEAFPFTDLDGYVRIKVNCTKDALHLNHVKTKYALLVTIETAPELGLPIYQEVAAKINTAIQVEN